VQWVIVNGMTNLDWRFKSPVTLTAPTCPQLEYHSSITGFWYPPGSCSQVAPDTIRANYGPLAGGIRTWRILTTPVGVEPVNYGFIVVPQNGSVP